MDRTREPFDELHYENRAEEAISWYRHYMSVEKGDLAAEYRACLQHDKRRVSAPMQEAAKQRLPDYLVEE